MNHLFATVIFGLTASLCWGSGDFSGGLASRRAYTGSVVLTDYAVGLVLLVTLALIGKEPFPDPADLLWGGLAGVAGVLGLLSFYAALSKAKMGIAAPVSALLTVALPVLFSAFTVGLPTLLQLGGFVLAGLSIALISRPQRAKGSLQGIGLAFCFHSFLQQQNATFRKFKRLITRYHSSSDLYSLAMKQVTDYYAVLGVDAHAPTEVIKKAFKHLALQYHPDIYKGEDAEERMRELLLAYQTLIDPESRRTYDMSRSEDTPGSSVPAEKNTEVSPTARRDRQRFYAFPTLNEGVPAQIDLGEITYLLSPGEVRRLKEQGKLRGAKAPSMAGIYYCHRCQHQWQAPSLPVFCPNCQAQDWREYLLLRCQHCHAVFESEQIRYEVGSLHYGDGALCPPYALFPLCPYCGKAQWCPAEEARLWNVRDRAARRAKWRRRFGLE